MGIDDELVWLSLHEQLADKPDNLLAIIATTNFNDFSAARDLYNLDSRLIPYQSVLKDAFAKLGHAREAWSELKAKDVNIIPFTEAKYPSRLKRGRGFPPIIYTVGNLSVADGPAIGICGSRSPTEDGLKFPKAFGKYAAKCGLAVVSGFAKGVDTAAHLGALNAQGKTIFVLAEGIGHFRLKKGVQSIEDFYERALVVSHFYPWHPWQVSKAMSRNGVICQLSDALVVVEAGETGGTISAGRECLRQRKPLFVLERSNPAKTAPGNKVLIREGGLALHNSEELLHALSDISRGTSPAYNSQSTPDSNDSHQLELPADPPAI